MARTRVRGMSLLQAGVMGVALFLGSAGLEADSWLVGTTAQQRSAVSSDTDARGMIEVRSKPDDGREEFLVRVENLAPGSTYTAYLDDGSGTLVPIGSIVPAGDGEGEIDLRTADGDVLPFDAVIADLQGRMLEVRDQTGAMVLFGEVPAYRPDGSNTIKWRTFLTRPAGSPDADARGQLQVERNYSMGRERLRIRAEHLDSMAPYSLSMDFPGLGWREFGDLDMDSDDSEGDFEVDTFDGDTLPEEAVNLDDLAGLPFRIEDDNGDTVLEGVVPDLSLGKPGRAVKGRSALSPGAAAPASKGRIDWKYVPKQGRSRFRVRVAGAGVTSRLELWVENPATSLLELVDSRSTSSGKAKFEFDTGDGEEMPHRVSRASALVGLAVEIRDDAAGVVATGSVPAVP